MTKQLVESVHMIVDGEFLQDMARTWYWFEDREIQAKKLLKESLMGITDKQVSKIINGDAILTGSSVCNKKDCSQCKDLKKITYLEKQDEAFKTEINKRKLWLHDSCYKIGQYHISRKTIDDYLEVLAEYYINQARGEEQEELDEYELNKFRNSLWTTTGHRIPSRNYIPDKKSIDYDFTKTINDFVNKTESRITKAGLFADDEIEKIKKEIKVIQKIKSKVKLIPKKAKGCTLIIIPDPKNNYNYKGINIHKEHLLNYLKQRQRNERAMKFTLNMDLDKEQVLKRYKNLQKTMGNIHTLLMKSMNLSHSSTGIYPKNTIEYFVNEAIQYFVLKTTYWQEGKTLKKLPDEIKLVLPENHGYVDVYVDGKLTEEKRDLR